MALLPGLLAIVVGTLAGWFGVGLARRNAHADSPWLRPALTALFSGLAAVAAAYLARSPWELPALVSLGLLLSLLAVVDLAEQRLPDALNFPAYAIFGALLLMAALATDRLPHLLRAAEAGGAFLVFYLVAAVLFPSGLYLGDVKLSGLLGLFLGWLGWAEVLAGFMGGFLLGGIVSLVLLVTRRGNLKSQFAFGPWMILGAYLGALLGPAAFPVFTMI